MSAGGKSEPDNLQVLCRNCNAVKGDKLEKPFKPPDVGSSDDKAGKFSDYEKWVKDRRA